MPLALIVATYLTSNDFHYNTVTICNSLVRLTMYVLNNKAAIAKIEARIKQNVEISEQTLQTAQGSSVPPIETLNLSVSQIENIVVESVGNEISKWIKREKH